MRSDAVNLVGEVSRAGIDVPGSLVLVGQILAYHEDQVDVVGAQRERPSP